MSYELKSYMYLLAFWGGVHDAAAAGCGWWYDCDGAGCCGTYDCDGEGCCGIWGGSCGVVGGAKAPTCGCWLLGVGKLFAG